MIKVGFIGAGNMGFAIMKGIADSADIDAELFVYDSYQPAIEKAEGVGAKACMNASEVAEKSDYVFLAVKPQQLDEVLDSVKPAVTKETVLVSICAGIDDEYIASKTVEGAKVVLVMPNTPLLLGEGATALSRSETVTDSEFSDVCSIFGSCGAYAVIPKNKMKEIIAINGSSPAFIYLYAQSFIKYAESAGIDGEVAKTLFAKSLVGSAKMITDSGYSIDKLIEMVSSKGGTTIAGLEQLRAGGLDEAVQNCCKACTNRAYELAKK